MRQLLGSRDPDSHDAILRELFLQKVPEGTIVTLTVAEDRTVDCSALTVHAFTRRTTRSWETAAARVESEIEQSAATITASRPAEP